MKTSRVWAMPDKWTFRIKPIAELLARYVGDGKGWVDPFAGMYSPAEFTNDLNPEMPTKYHMDALEFLMQLKGQYKGVIFDPPYSPRQVKECYESLGRDFTMNDGQIANRWTNEKVRLSEIILPGGLALCFGWNSNGIGECRGFELLEVVLVAHGAGHNDTIVTVERKIQGSLYQHD